MAMKEYRTRFGDKFIMLIDVEGELKLCYSNKCVEDKVNRELASASREKIRDPQRGYLTLYNKPLAILTITGWGRMDQRHIIVYCSLTLSDVVTDDCIPSLKQTVEHEIDICHDKLTTVQDDTSTALPNIPIMVPFKHFPSLSELPVGTCREIIASGYASITDRIGWLSNWRMTISIKPVNIWKNVKTPYFLGAKSLSKKLRVNKARRKYAVCKIVKAGDWAGILDYNKVKLLPGTRT